jgi:predicted CXXCH cytochrome family protein
LLNSTCLGCHTGDNLLNGKTPFVFSITAGGPTYGISGTEGTTTTLAGGNFYWVANVGNSRGHNVLGVGNADTLLVPPGFTGASFAADGSRPANGTWTSGQRVTCAGTHGCHGTHAVSSSTDAVRGGHHKGASGAITLPGTSPAGGFRMLVGVAGYEDSDWEFRPTTLAHNQYKGNTGTDNSTISSLCARCHGNFHAKTVSGIGTGSPWLRHPTDRDMFGLGGEYANYNGDKTYSVQAPVASTTVSAVKSAVLVGAGDAIVTCVSCHRAHGSPYYKMLRWDYANSVGAGCTYCHTSKN